MMQKILVKYSLVASEVFSKVVAVTWDAYEFENLSIFISVWNEMLWKSCEQKAKLCPRNKNKLYNAARINVAEASQIDFL